MFVFRVSTCLVAALLVFTASVFAQEPSRPADSALLRLDSLVLIPALYVVVTGRRHGNTPDPTSDGETSEKDVSISRTAHLDPSS